MILPVVAVSLRVLTYNIHHANPPGRLGMIDVEAIAQVVRRAKPDVAMIQEVDVRTRRSGTELDQAAALGRKTGMGSYFVRAIDFEGGEYGVAILSRFPLTARRRVALPTQTGTKGEPRVLAVAQIALPGSRTLTVACTHLDAQKAATNRLLQAEAIVTELAKAGPTILAGDFNATPGSEPLEILNRTFDGFGGEPTFPMNKPREAIDFVAILRNSGMRIVSREVLDEREASDHRPVLSVVEIP